MSGFDLLNNYIDNPEALILKSRSHTASSSTTTTTVEPVTTVPSSIITMAKSVCDYSTPVVANMPIGPAVNTGSRNFELCTGLIMMV